MRMTLGASSVSGTIRYPLVFLARSGKTIRDVDLISSTIRACRDRKRADTPDMKNAAHGVEIVFTDKDRREKTLYYSAPTWPAPVSMRGLERLCDRLGTSDASSEHVLLLHGNGLPTCTTACSSTPPSCCRRHRRSGELSVVRQWVCVRSVAAPGRSRCSRDYQPRLTQLFQSGQAGRETRPRLPMARARIRICCSPRARHGATASRQPINSGRAELKSANVDLQGKPLASATPDDPSPSSVAPAPANPAPKKTAKKTQRQQRANNTVRPQPFFWPFFWGQR